MTFPKKPALALLSLAVLAVGACTVPTETEVNMGQRLTWTLDGQSLSGQPQELTRFLRTQPGVDDVSVNVQEIDGHPPVIDLMAWGRGLDARTLAATVNDAFPAMAGARLATAPLTTEVRASLAEMLGQKVFHLEIAAEGTDEEIRASILKQLYASGFADDAKVEVNTENGVTTIGVEATSGADSTGAQRELVIEAVRQGE